MATHTRIRKSRGAYRGQISKSITKAETITSIELTEDHLDQLTAVEQHITKAFEQVRKLDAELLEITKDDDVAEVIVEADDHNAEVEEYLLKLKRHIERQTHKKKPTPTPAVVPPKAKTVRLPKLSLASFDGDLLKWQSFFDSFAASVHSDPDLDGFHKFQYLKAQLTGEASRVIQGLALTNANYAHALELLRNRYGQPHKLSSAYMKALWDLPKPSGEFTGLRHFYDTLEILIRGLDTLGKSENTYGDLLVPIVLEKLPGSIRQQLARTHGSSDWKLKDLRTNLLKEIEAIEEGNVTSYTTPSAISSSTAAFHTDTKPFHKTCAFCKDASHNSVNCKTVIDHDKRQQIVKRDRLCFNCLGNHKIKDCKSKRTCRHCSRKHHTSLCRSTNMGSETLMTQSTTCTDNEVRACRNTTQVHAKSVSAGDVNVDGLSKSGTVLLKTAVAEISSGSYTYTATILFDEGATRSFITKDFARKLDITPEGSQKIQLAAFGGKPSHVKSYDKVSFAVHTITGGKMDISALVVPKISAPIKNFVNASLLDLPHLRELPFAHPVSNVD
ncbi:uncharacterized protein LOC135496506 [Lineus longissimus]|uniref:uncharacterized protein LOC135496506 n=1 Tax=Lineus longissimus TaxID=88925 RepID=UPI00315CB8E0